MIQCPVNIVTRSQRDSLRHVACFKKNGKMYFIDGESLEQVGHFQLNQEGSGSQIQRLVDVQMLMRPLSPVPKENNIDEGPPGFKLDIYALVKEASVPVMKVFQIVIPYNQRLKLFLNINYDSMQDMFDKKHSLYVPYSPRTHENDFKYLILSPFHQNLAILDSQRYFREEARVKLAKQQQGQMNSRSLNDSLNEFDHIHTFSNQIPMRDQEILLLHSNTNGPQILEFKVLKGGMGEMHLTSIDAQFDQRWVNFEYQDKRSPKMPKEKHSCIWSVTKDGKQLQILYICYDKETQWKGVQGKRSQIKEILINI
ncbi:hypothetical protein FGO68_gene4794 [Halteria grandinella]|uniref:Uncharacterized protein n=1 Tax=Halteria grandinella TaxID=5974 RepID=A0A8J8NPT7_HALGN|nr:hypothetical protein FGO68_gene4794 [Halteria grandinella]